MRARCARARLELTTTRLELTTSRDKKQHTENPSFKAFDVKKHSNSQTSDAMKKRVSDIEKHPNSKTSNVAENTALDIGKKPNTGKLDAKNTVLDAEKSYDSSASDTVKGSVRDARKDSGSMKPGAKGNAALDAGKVQGLSDDEIVNNFKVRNVVFYPFFKRAFDVVVSFLAIVVLLLPFAFIAVAIKADSKGRVLYVSDRIGKGGKMFKLYKFRSMVDHADEKLDDLLKDRQDEWEVNFKLKNDPRITKLGSFLRKTSIDELPQLFNILKGDMSFVGPRPCSPREYLEYSQKDMLRLSVPQGLTGEWQTHGRSNTTFEERIDMDLDYIQNKRGFFYDLHLIFKTVIVALKQEGAE